METLVSQTEYRWLTPNPSTYVGSDSFTYRIKDSLGSIAIGTVNITVTNQAPVAVNDKYVIRGSQTQQLLPVVMDSDHDRSSRHHPVRCCRAKPVAWIHRLREH